MLERETVASGEAITPTAQRFISIVESKVDQHHGSTSYWLNTPGQVLTINIVEFYKSTVCVNAHNDLPMPYWSVRFKQAYGETIDNAVSVLDIKYQQNGVFSGTGFEVTVGGRNKIDMEEEQIGMLLDHLATCEQSGNLVTPEN